MGVRVAIFVSGVAKAGGREETLVGDSIHTLCCSKDVWKCCQATEFNPLSDMWLETTDEAVYRFFTRETRNFH